MRLKKLLSALVLSTGSLIASNSVMAHCGHLPDHAQLTAALQAAVSVTNGGLDAPMWATIVDRDGTVCAVTYADPELTGEKPWPASRIISAQKANTANSLTITSVPGLWSTALLFTPTQPNQFLYGLQFSNPVNAAEAYQGESSNWGSTDDYLAKNKIRIGGVNVFGGGVALWDGGNAAGGLGVSGDTSCADHNIALRTRDYLVANAGLSNNPAGQYIDNIVYDIVDGVSASGVGHPTCAGYANDPNEVVVNEQITGAEQNGPFDPWPTTSYPK